jgi:hypothetical protein
LREAAAAGAEYHIRCLSRPRGKRRTVFEHRCRRLLRNVKGAIFRIKGDTYRIAKVLSRTVVAVVVFEEAAATCTEYLICDRVSGRAGWSARWRKSRPRTGYEAQKWIVVLEHAVVAAIDDIQVARGVDRHPERVAESVGTWVTHAVHAVVFRDVVKVGLAEYQVGRLAVGEGLSVVPRQHAIIELFVAAEVIDVDVIRSRVLIDRHVQWKAETSAVNEVVIAGVEEDLPQHRIRRVVLCRERARVELEYAIVCEVSGEHIARRVDSDATGLADAARRYCAKIVREIFLSDDRICRRVDARRCRRIELEHPAIRGIGDVKIAVRVELRIDRRVQRFCGNGAREEWTGSLIRVAAGEVGLAKHPIGGERRVGGRDPVSER